MLLRDRELTMLSAGRPNINRPRGCTSKGSHFMTMNRTRSGWCLLACFLMISSICMSQQKFDVVYLKSGGKVIGTLVEKKEGIPVIIQMQSGEQLTIPWADIKSFDVIVVHPQKIDSAAATQAVELPPENALYAEAAGVGLLYSLNYERMVSDNVSLRIGYSSWSFTLPFIFVSESVSFTGIPIMVNLLEGRGNSKLEIGGGLQFCQVTTTSSTVGFFNSGSSSTSASTGFTPIGVASIAYRYQPNGGGLHFRAALDPLISSGGIKMTIGLSLGACF